MRGAVDLREPTSVSITPVDTGTVSQTEITDDGSEETGLACLVATGKSVSVVLGRSFHQKHT